MKRLLTFAFIGAGFSAAACHDVTAPKPKPAHDPYTIIYVVDDFALPIDTMQVRVVVTDSQPPNDIAHDTLSAQLTRTGPPVLVTSCFSMAETLGVRHVSATASADTGGVVLHYSVPVFDPSVGVDTTGGAGNTAALPWVWRWRVGDSTVTGFPRPASWPGGYCTF